MELLQRFARGEMEAFETLFRQYQGEVYGWIVRIVRDTGIAEDLTVETFWRIYKARGRFEPAGNFGAWARRIATNLAIDRLRAMRPEGELPPQLPHQAAPDAVLQQETREQIQRAFQQLPAPLRAAATLALIEERPYAEIAESLGTSAGAVRVRVFRAIRLLRKQLLRSGART